MYDVLARSVAGQRAIGVGVRVAGLIADLREQSGQVALCPLDTLLIWPVSFHRERRGSAQLRQQNLVGIQGIDGKLILRGRADDL